MGKRAYQEVTPVLYGENMIRVLPVRGQNRGDVCFNGHYHERMELLRIHRGTLSLEVDSEHFEALPDTLVIVNPNQSHTGIAATDGLVYDVIMFDLANLNNSSFAFRKYLEPILRQKVTFFTCTTHPEILHIADSLVRAHTEKQTSHPLHVLGMVYSLLGAFYQYCAISERPPDKRARLNEITAYIEEHFSEPMSNRSLSAMFGYNEAYFSRMFKNNFNVSLSRHIQSLRLEHAQKLLRNTDESIAAVAIQCGFSDVYYFSNRFKRFTGKSPREFRALHRNADI